MYAKSHHQNRQSHSFSRRKRNRNIIVSLLIFASLFTWIFSVVRFCSLDYFNIYEVRVVGVDLVTARSMESAVLQIIDGKYIGLLSKSSKFIYPHDAIVKRIESMYINVDSVTITNNDRNILDISIKPKSAAAIVCIGYPDYSDADLVSSDDDSCYYADEKGLIYNEAVKLEGKIYNHYYIPSLSENSIATSSIIGSYASSTKEFLELQKLYSQIARNGIVIDSILLKGGGEYELYIENRAISNADKNIAVVYMNRDRSLDEQLSNLVSFWSNMTNKIKNNSATSTFDYIDVRYGANVFYK
ncbi:MAG: hypothetical protein WCK03_04090 [Candidatus Taylorbacteria bacterium]